MFDINNIEICKNKIEIKSTKSGYITDIDSIKLASLANSLGAGRKSKDDAINYGVGIELCKKVNDKIIPHVNFCGYYSTHYHQLQAFFCKKIIDS